MKSRILLIVFSFSSIFCFAQQGFSNNKAAESSGDTIFVSDQSIKNLEVLCKVWGFLKYHHPAVTGGDFDWDEELFKIMPHIASAKTDQERNNELYEWVNTLGTIKKEKPYNYSQKSIKLLPDFSWINDLLLGKKLSEQLLIIKDVSRKEKSHYVDQVKGVGNPIFTNENNFASVYLNYKLRLLGLFRYWNIIQYYFPYKNLIEENWNSVLKEFIPQVVVSSTKSEYYFVLLKLFAKIHDSHAVFYPADTSFNKGVNNALIKLAVIEDKPVVVENYEEIKSDSRKLQHGDLITEINNRKIEEIVKEKIPFTSASNYVTQLRNIYSDLFKTNDLFLNVKFIRGNIPDSVKLNCYPKAEYYKAVKQQEKDTCFKILNNEIAYLFLENIPNADLPGIMDVVFKTKGLILDLRTYPRNFLVFSLGQYFVDRPVAFVKFTNPSIKYPGLFEFIDELRLKKQVSETYNGKIIILVNETTQSSAEYTTMAFQAGKNVTVIGSQTAGADGNVSSIPLPGGSQTKISGIGVYYPDGRETQRQGVKIDLVVKPTVKGVEEGRDELIEKAIEIINEN